MINAFKNNFSLFLEHDAENECCNLKISEKGLRLNETFSLSEIL